MKVSSYLITQSESLDVDGAAEKDVSGWKVSGPVKMIIPKLSKVVEEDPALQKLSPEEREKALRVSRGVLDWPERWSAEDLIKKRGPVEFKVHFV